MFLQPLAVVISSGLNSPLEVGPSNTVGCRVTSLESGASLAQQMADLPFIHGFSFGKVHIVFFGHVANAEVNIVQNSCGVLFNIESCKYCPVCDCKAIL